MSCIIKFIDRRGNPVKTTTWSATPDSPDNTRVEYVTGSSAKIPVPFEVFDRYTDHCSARQLTADFLPENIPNILREFSHAPQEPSKNKRLSDNPAFR